MSDVKAGVEPEDYSAAQQALLARIRRGRRAMGLQGVAQASERAVRTAIGEGQHRNKPVGHGVALDAKALLERKDADLGDVERAFEGFRSVFRNFQTGTGYLPPSLRQLVNEFEAAVVLKMKPVSEALQEARRAAEQ